MVRVRSRVRLVGGLLLLALSVAFAPVSASAGDRTLLVPEEYDTVQAAVDAATGGDTILVNEGVYNEFVSIEGADKSGITIRGVDRNAVVFDGKDDLPMAIMVKQANDVRLENLTAHNYTGNGFYWQSVDGYVGRYLTTWNIKVYGIYAFDSTRGLFEHDYASGSADSSFYIGQCYPCDATIRDVVAERSIIGYSGTNAGGELAIEDSRFSLNGAGIVPNSLDSEANPPQRDAIIRNNIVEGSGTADVPVKGIWEIAKGLGIAVAGGVGNIVEGNTVTNSTRYGIVVTPLPDENVWQPKDNIVRNNTVTGSGSDEYPEGADLAIVAASESGNCFEGNTFGTSDPPQIEIAWACADSVSQVSGAGSPVAGGSLILTYGTATSCDQGVDPACTEAVDYTKMPEPAPQTNMPASEAGLGFAGGPAAQLAGPPDEGTTTGSGSTPVTGAPDSQDTGGTGMPATGAGALTALLGLALVGSSVAIRRRD